MTMHQDLHMQNWTVQKIKMKSLVSDLHTSTSLIGTIRWKNTTTVEAFWFISGRSGPKSRAIVHHSPPPCLTVRALRKSHDISMVQFFQQLNLRLHQALILGWPRPCWCWWSSETPCGYLHNSHNVTENRQQTDFWHWRIQTIIHIFDEMSPDWWRVHLISGHPHSVWHIVRLLLSWFNLHARQTNVYIDVYNIV